MSGSGSDGPSYLDPPASRPRSATPGLPPLSGKAVWSLVLGVASAVLVFGCGLLAGIPAIGLGLSAKRDVALSGGAERGRGLAIAGIITGIIGTLISALFLVAVGAGMWSAHDQSPSRDWKPPTASTNVDTEALKPFYAQRLRWSDCGEGECTRVLVPVDYAKPKARTMRIAVKVIPSIGAGGHSLFLNPGGPGASGVMLADYFATKISPEVRKRYDLVNVDPRGVGRSGEVDCLSDRAFATWAATDPDPDTPEEVEAFRADNRRFGEGCMKRSGAVAAHVSTEEVARDFDILRALLGREKFDWFGFSYGTQIGATYATLFPKRVGRMVLDGPVDSSLSTIDASLAQAVGFQDALDAYVRSCAGGMWCPLGRDESKGVDEIVRLLARLDQHPLQTDDGNRKLTEGLAFYGIVKPLYSEATWPTLTQALDAAFDGDGSVLMRLADSYFSDASGEAFRAISCLDQRDEVSVEDVEQAEPRFRKASPAFGPALAWGTLGCTDWPVKAEHPQIDIDPRTKAPILIVGATRDPATPYEGAKALARQIPSSLLLTRVGGGHTSYAGGDACIDEAVDAYLLSGTMPAKGTVCR